MLIIHLRSELSRIVINLFFCKLKVQVITGSELAFIIFYAPSMVFCLLTPCNYGSIVACRGENLTFEIVAANWISATQHYKMLFMMTIGKLQTSFITKVGYFIPLSLDTFLYVNIPIFLQ